MDVTSMSTEELDRLLHELLAAEQPQASLIRAIGAELRRREPEPTPEQLRAVWPEYMRIYYREPVLDPSTGIMLQPSCHGADCPGADVGCCDECDYYLACFPDWRERMEQV